MAESLLENSFDPTKSTTYAVNGAIRSYLTYFKTNSEIEDVHRFVSIVESLDSEEKLEGFYKEFQSVSKCSFENYLKARKIRHDDSSCIMMYPFVPRWKILADSLSHSQTRFRIDVKAFAMPLVCLNNDEKAKFDKEYERLTGKKVINTLVARYQNKKKLRKIIAQLYAMKRDEVSHYENSDLKAACLEIIGDKSNFISERVYQILGTKSWEFLADMIKYWDENLVSDTQETCSVYLRNKCDKHNEYLVRWIYRRAVFGHDAFTLADVISSRASSVMVVNRTIILASVFMARFYLPEVKSRVKDFSMAIGSLNNNVALRIINDLSSGKITK